MELMSLSVEFVKQAHLSFLHSSPHSFIALTKRPSDMHDGCQVLCSFYFALHLHAAQLINTTEVLISSSPAHAHCYQSDVKVMLSKIQGVFRYEERSVQ
jgi:hypothetical protein